MHTFNQLPMNKPKSAAIDDATGIVIQL
jgi:hypothetical protein